MRTVAVLIVSGILFGVALAADEANVATRIPGIGSGDPNYREATHCLGEAWLPLQSACWQKALAAHRGSYILRARSNRPN